MVYITGDCHADWFRFSRKSFRDAKELTMDDYVIVCGDFGIWHDTKEERWNLKWLESLNFNILFVDGNHENFDRLYSDEFQVIDFHGGKAHQIRKNVFHLMRGYIFELCGKKFFAFGGANSHDIGGGILDRDDFDTTKAFNEMYKRWYNEGRLFRVNHVSWWKEEMPSKEEMDFGLQTLKDSNNEVDYIISHCGPQHVVSMYSHGFYEPDDMTSYLNMLAQTVKFDRWFFGHYHQNMCILDKYEMLYENIVRIV